MNWERVFDARAREHGRAVIDRAEGGGRADGHGYAVPSNEVARAIEGRVRGFLTNFSDGVSSSTRSIDRSTRDASANNAQDDRRVHADRSRFGVVFRRGALAVLRDAARHSSVTGCDGREVLIFLWNSSSFQTASTVGGRCSGALALALPSRGSVAGETRTRPACGDRRVSAQRCSMTLGGARRRRAGDRPRVTRASVGSLEEGERELSRLVVRRRRGAPSIACAAGGLSPSQRAGHRLRGAPSIAFAAR